jgi:hypothetical protein
MKSAMLAADALVAARNAGRRNDTLGAYEEALRNSWVAEELRMVRNVQPLLARFGAIVGTALAGLKCGCARWGSVCPIHWVTRAIVLAPCARQRADCLSRA